MVGSIARNTRVASVLAAALALAPGAARAQVTDRLAVHVEGVVGTLLGSPDRDLYGLGVGFGARPAVRVVGPLWAHLHAGYGRWAGGAAGNGATSMWSFGAGLTVAPLVSLTAGRPFVQVEGGYGLTGANADGRGDKPPCSWRVGICEPPIIA